MNENPVHQPLPSLADDASALRHAIVESLHACGGGHYGGSLSVIDILLVLYKKIMWASPQHVGHPERDRFILSKGHAAMAYYALLKNLGYIAEPLDTYGTLHSPYEGHPDMHCIRGIDFSTGSLGQGLAVGLGMAFALRSTPARVWVVLGDGECQEGQVWETAMIAERYNNPNLIAIVDCNKFQEWGWSHDDTIRPEPVINIVQKWKAFGWHVLQVNGHDHQALEAVLEQAGTWRQGPVAVIAHTVKGKGFSMAEADPARFHCTTLTDSEQKLWRKGL